MNERILFLFPSESRQRRLAEIETGTVPKEFFYGYLQLLEDGHDVMMANTRKDPDGRMQRAELGWEILRNRVSNSGFSRQRVAALHEQISQSYMALSFTDWFSLSLGLYGKSAGIGSVLVGGFHGLADMGGTVKPPLRWGIDAKIRQALKGLDHLFFFGESDRQQSILRFGLDERKTSLFQFGIDTDFWTPSLDTNVESHVFSVGSDPSRDYETLVNCGYRGNMRILTRLPVDAGQRPQTEVLRGSYHDSPITDVELRDMYRRAEVVTVPLKDVWQPTGYSVTLQAMACGKAVVLSKIKGLWDPEVFHSEKNCILVEPGNLRALGDALERLRGDPALRDRIGSAARQTAVEAFALSRMNRSIRNLVEHVRQGNKDRLAS